MRVNLLNIIIVLILSSCQSDQANVAIVSNDVFSKTWENKSDYPEAQDYVKNLDFNKIDNPDTHPIFVEMLTTIKQMIDGEGLTVIPNIQESIANTNHDMIRQVYMGFVYELLINAEKYKAVVENFPDRKEDRKEFSVFSQFPEESYMIAQNPIQSKKLEKVKYGLFAVNMKANNTHAMGFFDTGAEVSHMPRSFAEKIGVVINSDTKVEFDTPNGYPVYGYPAYVDEMVVGDIVIKNHPVIVFEDENERLGKVDDFIMFNFTLGWPIIKNLHFELDFISHTYKADFSKNKKISFKNLFWFGFAGLKVNNLNGQSLIFGLDTGADATELKPNILNKMNLGILKEDTVHIGGHGGIKKMTLSKAENVSLLLASHRLDFEELLIRENTDFNFIAQDGTIGADIFKDNVITIDYKNGIFNIEN